MPAKRKPAKKKAGKRASSKPGGKGVPQKTKDARTSKPKKSRNRKRDNRTKWKRFKPEEFEDLLHQPKSFVLQEIVRRGLVTYGKAENVLMKPDADTLGPVDWGKMQVIHRTDKSGGTYFYHVNSLNGKRRYKSTGIRVDIKPLPTNEEMNANPRWWERSAHCEEIQSKIIGFPFLFAGTKVITYERTPAKDYLLALLSTAGFDALAFEEVCRKELGPNGLTKLAAECCSLSPEEVERRTKWLEENLPKHRPDLYDWDLENSGLPYGAQLQGRKRDELLSTLREVMATVNEQGTNS